MVLYMCRTYKNLELCLGVFPLTSSLLHAVVAQGPPRPEVGLWYTMFFRFNKVELPRALGE